MTEIALNILDIVQNSLRAGAGNVSVTVRESVVENSLRITVSDDGSGISPEMLPTVTDPFATSRTTRKVGMGLPFLKYHSEIAGGGICVVSEKDSGTSVDATFKLDHIDRQPLGDIAGVMRLLILANPRTGFLYRHITDRGEFSLDTAEIREIFGEKGLSDPGLMREVQEMLRDNLASIGSKG